MAEETKTGAGREAMSDQEVEGKLSAMVSKKGDPRTSQRIQRRLTFRWNVDERCWLASGRLRGECIVTACGVVCVFYFGVLCWVMFSEIQVRTQLRFKCCFVVAEQNESCCKVTLSLHPIMCGHLSIPSLTLEEVAYHQVIPSSVAPSVAISTAKETPLEEYVQCLLCECADSFSQRHVLCLNMQSCCCCCSCCVLPSLVSIQFPTTDTNVSACGTTQLDSKYMSSPQALSQQHVLP